MYYNYIYIYIINLKTYIMQSVLLKIENNLVKVLCEENNYLLHKYICNDLSIKGILSQLNKEEKKYDLNVYVEDIQYKNK